MNAFPEMAMADPGVISLHYPFPRASTGNGAPHNGFHAISCKLAGTANANKLSILVHGDMAMSFNLKIPAFILGAALVCGSVTIVDAQTGAPAGGGAAGGASGLNNPSVGTGTKENNSGGTTPGPVYPGPAAQSGANSPPVNSGITDPKTGANNDTVPLKDSGRANPPTLAPAGINRERPSFHHSVY